MEDDDESGAAGDPTLAASTSGLKDELCRRLNIREEQRSVSVGDFQLPPRIFCEERHDAGDGGQASTSTDVGLFSKWRQKEKLKTTAVALVLCLNIGVDPPDVIKISPCARLECWVDPLSMQPAKALETIGKNLQAQYERWQPRAKYKMHLDPTVEDVKKLCVSSRRNARNERVLFHYNGHGVPRPTANGELWVFNARYTQYIPLSIYELQGWLATPCIYVLDCSAAGIIINSLKAMAEQRGALPQGVLPSGDPMREIIALAACGANEQLPQHPDLPADVFTACLTTPIKVALRWFCSRSLLRHDGLTKELIDRIPGRQNDRKTPLGELNWIFTAITDTIAWNVLPRALFQKLFRQDLLVASLFRNFLLAERIMVAAGCTPVSYPRLPPTHQHPMWQAWDMAAEMCLLQLPGLLADPQLEFVPGVFFSEQLTAFELWLAHGSKDKQPPEQLPIVLQVLLSQVHRLRALVLLGRFLDMGAWAVDLALSVGIFPYVLKLLQTTSHELRTTLVFIWCKILALDRSCQVDLVKDADVVTAAGHVYFIKYLESMEAGGMDMQCKAQAAFVLAMICDGHPKGQALCAKSGLLGVALRWLRRLVMQPYHAPGSSLFAKWLLLSVGKLCEDMPDISALAYREGVLQVLEGYLNSLNPEIRAAAVFALGTLVGSGATDPESARAGGVFNDAERLEAERQVAWRLLRLVYDASPLVRCELAVALARFAAGHSLMLQDAITSHQRKVADYVKVVSRHWAEVAGGSGSENPGVGVPHAHDTVSHAHSAPLGLDVDHGLGLRSGSYSMQKSASVPGRTSDEEPERCSSSGSNGSRGAQMEDGSGPQSPQSMPASGLLMSDPLVGWSDAALTYAMAAGMTGPDDRPGGATRDTVHLYSCLLETVLVLATDPSPKVAKLGQQVLSIAQCELAPMVMAVPAAMAAAANSSTTTTMPVGSPMRSSFGSFTLWRGRSPWRAAVPQQPPAKSLERAATAPQQPSTRSLERTSAGASPAVSQPPSPTRELTTVSSAGSSRHPYILRAASPLRDAAGFNGPALMAAGRPRLPQSQIFKFSCEYFSRPMLEPMSSAWREGEGALVAPWTASPDPQRLSQRVRDMEFWVAKCRSTTQPRLRDQVFSVEFGAEAATALAFHSFHPLLVVADDRGYIRVHDFVNSTSESAAVVHSFHVTGPDAGRNPATAKVVFLQQINETYSSMLMTGCADGAVRLWRNYTIPSNIRLASGWQAAPTNPPPFHVHCPATFAWSSPLLALYAAGGTMPEGIHRWDVNCERMVQVIHMRGTAAAAAGSPPGGTAAAATAGVERIALSQAEPQLLLAQCLDSSVRLFDIRMSQQPAAVLRPHGTNPMAGAVIDPSGQTLTRIITGSIKGELKFIDLRMAANASDTSSLLEAGVTRCVDAHSKGNMTALVAHPYAPLIATSTARQVVKVWQPDGSMFGAVRPSATATQRVAPISCLVFHPYQLMLAAGGCDSSASVYMIDNSAQSSAQRASSVTSSASGS